MIGDRADLQAHDIVIDVNTLGDTFASSANSGGGLVSVGVADAKTTLDLRGTLTIGDSTNITADHNLKLSSDVKPVANVLADSNGGGLVSVAKSSVTATVNYASLLKIGTGAMLTAEEQLEVESQATIDVDATVNTDASGLGAGADSRATVNAGGATDGASTIIGAGAELKGSTVELVAILAEVNVRADALGETNAAAADAHARAPINVTDEAAVRLASGSRIVGNAVTITAAHNVVDIVSTADADCDCGFGDANALTRIDYITKSLVEAAPGSTVVAHDLTVHANQDIRQFDRTARADVAGLGSNNEDEEGKLNAARVINWRGDVVLLSGADPVLLVDANGKVVREENVTATVEATTVSVDPIINDSDAGAIQFLVNTVTKHDDVEDEPPQGVIQGTGGRFNIGAVYRKVELRNQSDKTLLLGGIHVANPNAEPTVEFDAQKVTINFSIGTTAGTTAIEILNEGMSDVQIAGVIDNPIGTTTITNTKGGIFTTPGGVIRSNRLTWDSQGAIGGGENPATQPMRVEPVRSAGLPPDITARAGQDILLSLTGRWREAGTADEGNPIFNSAAIVTDGNIDLLLNPAQQETTPLGTAGSLQVTVPQLQETTPLGTAGSLQVTVPQLRSLTGKYFEKFQPDAESPQARPSTSACFPI